MATVDTGAPPEAAAQRKHRSAWLWISVVLGIAVIGLLIWALTLRSDRDDAEQQASELQSQVDEAGQRGGAFVAAAQTVYDELTAQLGATQEDLAAVEQDIQDAKQAGEQAADDAAAAKSKATIAADCAKAYIAAFGSLFEGDSVQAQAAAVRTQVQSISADCKAALGDS